MPNSASVPDRSAVHRQRTGLLVWWHLLSLDAPSVAVVWTWFQGKTAGVAISGPALAAMFLAVWILYVADRLLDVRNGLSHLEARHRFHERHRRLFQEFLVGAAIVLVLLVRSMSAREIGCFGLLGAALCMWFGVIHGFARKRHERLHKEVGVGLFFALATAIPAATGAGRVSASLLAGGFLLGCVCTLNCYFLADWEAGRTRPSTSRAAWVLMLLCCTALRSTPHAAVAVGLAALLLLLVERTRRHFSPRGLRAAADATLLTPLLLLPFLA